MTVGRFSRSGRRATAAARTSPTGTGSKEAWSKWIWLTCSTPRPSPLRRSLRVRDDVAVGIEEREFGHAVPLLFERHHYVNGLFERLVGLGDVHHLDEQCQ